MNKIIILILCLCCAFTIARAEEGPALNPSDANIVGHVVDRKTGEHLSFITIFLKGTTIGTSTDGTGHYYLKNLPEGEFTVVMKTMGYKTIETPVMLKKGRTLEINFEVEEEALSLDGVVVSANRNETTRRMAPSLVNVLDSKMFETTHATSLADGLNFQPGVRVENNCQNCGFQQVRINGLEGPYTQILVDSRPIFSALTGVYGLEQIPANMIERVEIMRGGGSALFGSSAIAGTINIITKEPLRNSAQIAHSLTMIGGSRPDNNTTLNASLVTDDHKAGVYLFGQSRHRSAYDHDGDGFSELGQLEARTVGFRSYLKTSTYSKLTFEYHHMQEFRRGGDMLDRPPHEAHIAEQLQHSIDGGSLKYDYFSPNEKNRLSIFASAANTDRDSYYGPGNDPLKAYGKTTDLIAMGGAQYVHTFDKCLFMPSDLTAGLEYNRDRLKDNMWGYDRHTDQTVNIYSAFLQNEWKNERWSILVGGRLDKHNMVDNIIFSPRANLRFNPTQNINLRLSYSSGFRAPQAFDEDMHIENVGGTVAMIERTKNLKEEKSQSFSASADIYHRFGAFQTNFLIEGFYTKLTDVFVLGEPYNRGDGVLVKLRSNGPGAKVVGVTLEGKLAYLSLLQVQAGLTLQRSRYDEPHKWHDDVPAKRTIFRTPNVYGYFTATYIPIKPLSIALSGTYTGSMFVQRMDITAENAAMGDMPERKAEAVKTPKFLDLGVKLAYDFKLYKTVDLQLSGGVQNILEAYQKDFDRGANRDSGYIYGPALPRSFFAGVKISY